MVNEDPDLSAIEDVIANDDGPLGQISRDLIGCDYGAKVYLRGDETWCRKRAVQRVCLHGADGEMTMLKFCKEHVDVVGTQTDPHVS